MSFTIHPFHPVSPRARPGGRREDLNNDTGISRPSSEGLVSFHPCAKKGEREREGWSCSALKNGIKSRLFGSRRTALAVFGPSFEPLMFKRNSPLSLHPEKARQAFSRSSPVSRVFRPLNITTDSYTISQVTGNTRWLIFWVLHADT